MKIATVLGTRPEIIKLSPLLTKLPKKFDHILIHTGQHYDFEMDSLFFEELKLKRPDYNLEVGSCRQGRQTAIMLDRIEHILLKELPDIVLVLGDTNSVLAGALAASKLHIRVAHVEAGCRSFNRQMPEEINRIIVDNISDILFAPDRKAYDILIKEGIPRKKVHLVGSTVFEACLRNRQFLSRSDILSRLGLRKDRFVLVTLHRAGNTDDRKRLESIISALNILTDEIDIVFPIHPRTLRTIRKNKIRVSKKIKLIKPLGYIDFLKLMSAARFIMSDSGGIQEETLVFNKPCLIPREDSEWMRLVDAGKNFLVGANKARILRKTRQLVKDDNLLKRIKAIRFPYEKNASQQIIKALK